MAEHRTLTGTALHEPKGTDAAAVNTTYFADGAGSGTYRKVTADDLDASAKQQVVLTLAIDNTADTFYIPCPLTGSVTTFYAVPQSGGAAGTDTTLTLDGQVLTVAGTPVQGAVYSATGTTCTAGTTMSLVLAPGSTLQPDGLIITIVIRAA